MTDKLRELAEKVANGGKGRILDDYYDACDPTRILALLDELDELRRDNEDLKKGVNPLVYCELCGSCGEDGCCPPEKCLLAKARTELDALKAENATLSEMKDEKNAEIVDLLMETDALKAELKRLREGCEGLVRDWNHEDRVLREVLEPSDFGICAAVLEQLLKQE